MGRLVIIPVACASAFGAAFAAFSVLQLLETITEVPPVDEVTQPPYAGVFGFPWDTTAIPLIWFSASVGLFCSVRACTSDSALWRFHLPFVFGLLLLTAALSVAVSAIRWSSVWSVDSARIWPAPMQCAVLTMFGLFTLIAACHRR
jgi:hypothetical protein